MAGTPFDVLARTLEVLRLDNGRWTMMATHAGDDVVRAEPFANIELELRVLWGDDAGDPVGKANRT